MYLNRIKGWPVAMYVLYKFPEGSIMVTNEGNTALHFQFPASWQHEGAVIWIRMFNPECLLKIKWNLMPHKRKRMRSCAKSIFIEFDMVFPKSGRDNRFFFCSGISHLVLHQGFCILYNIFGVAVFRSDFHYIFFNGFYMRTLYS